MVEKKRTIQLEDTFIVIFAVLAGSISNYRIIPTLVGAIIGFCLSKVISSWKSRRKKK